MREKEQPEPMDKQRVLNNSDSDALKHTQDQEKPGDMPEKFYKRILRRSDIKEILRRLAKS